MNNSEISRSELLTALAQIELIAYQAAAVDGDAARAVHAEIGRMEALTPILDPTWFNQNMDNVKQRSELVGAFLSFRAKVLKIAPDLVTKVESADE